MLTREDLAAIGTIMDEKLEARLKPIEERLTSIEGRVTGIEERVTGIEGRVTGIEERVSGIEERVSGIEESVTEIEERVSGIEERVTGVEGRVTGIEERLTATEKETHELKILMENETNRAVGLVLDGHESLRQMIEGRLVTKDEREQDRIRICTLEGVTKLHTTQIAELKKKIV